MEEKLSIIELEPAHAARADVWFDDGTANTLLKSPSLNPAQALYSGRQMGWSGLIDGHMVAVVVISVDERHRGWLNFAVEPASRRQGIAAYMVGEVLKDPKLKELHSLYARISQENTAGQKILLKHGFVRLGTTDDGSFEFRLR